MKDNIVLIGFMGCGKTSVGSLLAEEMEYTFLDTDQTMEELEHMTVSEMFSVHGEQYFRNLETETIKNMANEVSHAVVSTGGGLPLRESNGTILKELGFVVYLRVQKDTVLDRLKGDTTRPLLQGDHVSEKVSEMLIFRDPIYEVTAHMTIDVDNLTLEEIIQEIKRNFDIMKQRFVNVREQEKKESESLGRKDNNGNG